MKDKPSTSKELTREQRKRLDRIAILWPSLGLALIILACLSVFINFKIMLVSTGSMSPTVEAGQYCLIQTLYRPEQLDYGDIVCFQQGDETWTKRLIGKPGDTIEITENGVVRNDRYLEEPYIPADTVMRPAEPLLLDVDEYFVLGDNRENSLDSRYIGPIKEENLQYRCLYIYKSVDDIESMILRHSSQASA